MRHYMNFLRLNVFRSAVFKRFEAKRKNGEWFGASKPQSLLGHPCELYAERLRYAKRLGLQWGRTRRTRRRSV